MPEAIKEIRPLIFIVTAVILFLAITLILFTLTYQTRKNKHLNEKEQLQSQFQQTLLQTQLEIQEQTLKIISQEIHDNIGQILSLAKLNLNTMDISNLGELQQKITDSKSLVSKAIHDLRDLSKSLNTDNISDMGLMRAIEYELDMVRKIGYKTIFKIEGAANKLEPQKELILFRIVQETINNILKHSEAKVISIKANYSENELELVITDDGKGVDLTPMNEKTNSNFGLGIRNMNNRAKLIGADFNMSSRLGDGTVVKLVVPY